ncbi:MAG: efflux RND transporter periplasmic adaptor subunit [Deltaproteobacteria bacterium]|nr:efflux RND transporter periplasmic adaptor subunit [Deltaproteobacteria bacterium]MBW2415381.1 efflux RND transporter periplasmic adaptor subunit [Deltaproteobacteria bacterium]
MTRVQQVVGAIAVVSVLLALWLFRTSPSAVASRERADRIARAEELAPVATGGTGMRTSAALEIEARQVRVAPVRRVAEVAAVLDAVRRVSLAAEVEGRVVEVLADEHARVEAGAPLVRLEQGFHEAAVLRAEGVLERARANHELARLDLERQRGLSKRRVGSTADLDRAVSTERARAADVQEARAGLADARLRLSKALIRAPFAGFVERLDLEPGAYVRVGERVADLLDLDEIEIEVGLTDREIVAIVAGDAATLRVDVWADEEFAGVVTGVGSAADPQSQKYPVEMRVPNPDHRLLPGMLGRVRFELGEGRAAIRIPRAAAQSEFELSYVYVIEDVDGASVAMRRRVSTRRVPFRPDLLEVLNGLQEGDRVAVSRIRELRDGLSVRIRGKAL